MPATMCIGYRYCRREAGSRDRRRSERMAHGTPGGAAGYRRDDADAVPVPGLRSDASQGAEEAAHHPSQTLSDTTGPAYGRGLIEESDNDLTRQHGGEPLGERIIVRRTCPSGERRRTPRT